MKRGSKIFATSLGQKNCVQSVKESVFFSNQIQVKISLSFHKELKLIHNRLIYCLKLLEFQ